MSALALAPEALPPQARALLVERIPETIASTTSAVTRATEAAIWVDFATWSQRAGRTDEEWAARYIATVTDSQTRLYGASSSLYADYLALASGRRAIAPVLALDSSILIGADDPWTLSPPKRLGAKLAGGSSWPEAVDQAGRYAAGLASLDVAWTQRAALRDVSASNPRRVIGQRKVLGGGSCGWCRVVADRLYGADSNVPTHAFDRCGVAPVVADDAFSPGQLASGEWEEIIAEPAVPSTDLLAADRFAVIERMREAA